MQRREFLASTGAAAISAVSLSSNSAQADIPISQRIAPKPATVAQSLPNIILRTQDNEKVRLYEDLLKDKIFMINMFYVACTDGQCPLVTANLARVQPLIGSRLGRDIFMYSITLEPELDTPESLKAYTAHFNVKPGWTFLTGERDDIERLRKALGFWDPDPIRDAKKTTHAGMAKMANEPLDRWIGCPTLAEPREIRRTLSYLDWPKGWKGGSRKG